MERIIHLYFEKDHQRLDDLFEQATSNINAIDLDLYQEFRTGLLTHIKMEEKILFKMAQIENRNQPLPLASQLRLEHGALTTLMVCFPSPEVIFVIRYLLEKHNFIEEKNNGMYDQCSEIIKNKHEELFAQLDTTTPVPIHPINTHPKALMAAKKALKRAGYDFDEICKNNL